MPVNVPLSPELTVIGSAAAGGFASPGTHRHDGGVSVIARLNSVLARLQDRKRLIRRVYLKDIVAVESGRTRMLSVPSES